MKVEFRVRDFFVTVLIFFFLSYFYDGEKPPHHVCETSHVSLTLNEVEVKNKQKIIYLANICN